MAAEVVLVVLIKARTARPNLSGVIGPIETASIPGPSHDSMMRTMLCLTRCARSKQHTWQHLLRKRLGAPRCWMNISAESDSRSPPSRIMCDHVMSHHLPVGACFFS